MIEAVLYTYDDDGNRTSRTSGAGVDHYHYGLGWRLSSIERASTTTQSFTYDDAGRVTAVTRDGHTYALSHNALDQLVSATVDGSTTTSWTFDGEDARVGITDASGTRRIVVGPEQGEGLGVPHAVTDATGTLDTGYVYAAGRPLLRYTGTSALYYLEDGLGSVIGLADATATATARIEYDAFGNVRSSMGVDVALDETTGGDFRFRGMWQDEATGLYYARARMYDAQTGRFLSRDAVEGEATEVESYLGYQFAYANPLTFSDPTGAFTINEQSVSQQIQQVLNNLPQTTLRGLIQYARSSAQDAVADAVQDAVMGIGFSLVNFAVPGAGSALGAFASAGAAFENAVEGGLCGFLGFRGSTSGLPSMNQPTSWLRLAVPISQGNGDPRSDGISCAGRTQHTGFGRFQSGTVGVSYPDFLLTGFTAQQVRAGSRTFLIGDAKLTMPPGSGRRTRRQFATMAKHAAHRSFGFVLVLAFRTRGHISTWPVTRQEWQAGAILRVVSAT